MCVPILFLPCLFSIMKNQILYMKDIYSSLFFYIQNFVKKKNHNKKRYPLCEELDVLRHITITVLIPNH